MMTSKGCLYRFRLCRRAIATNCDASFLLFHGGSVVFMTYVFAVVILIQRIRSLFRMKILYHKIVKRGLELIGPSVVIHHCW